MQNEGKLFFISCMKWNIKVKKPEASLNKVNMLLESRRRENPGGYSHAFNTYFHKCLPDLGLGAMWTLEDKLKKKTWGSQASKECLHTMELLKI